MSPDLILIDVIPRSEILLPYIKPSVEARALLLAIGLQESGFRTRRQEPGPARGFWQFEKGGGVVGVLTHPTTKRQAKAVCEARAVAPISDVVYQALEKDDVLACALARLLLYTDPKPLPAVGQVKEAWEYYLRTWRPGKPHENRWQVNYATAMDTLKENRQL